MPLQGINFQGGFIPLPGVYYADNVSAVNQNNVLTTPPLIFLGYGYGPKPFTVNTYYNPQNLITALRGGPAAAYVPFITNPSPQYTGAQQITFIDVSSNTQSTLNLQNSGSTTALALTSTLYGPPSNLLQASVASNSGSGVNITLIDNYTKTQTTGTGLGVPLQIAYVGSVTGNVGVTITASAILASSSVPAESTFIPIGSGGYTTVSQLVQAIDGTSAWTANVFSATAGTLPASGLTASGMGWSVTVTGTTATPVYQNVYAYLNDPAFWVNNFASSFATAVASGTDVSGNALVSGQAKYFTGAVGGAPTTASYASGFNIALQYPGWVVFADSNTPAVRALGAQHAYTASTTPYGMWRRFVTGSLSGETAASAQTNASALNAKETIYVWPGITQVSVQTGLPTTYNGLYSAAMVAGIIAGAPVNIPLTNKQLNGTGVEQTVNTTTLANLQNNGVLALFMPLGSAVPVVLSDMTTWQSDNNVENTSSQQVAARQWLAYTTVNALQPWVGSIAAPVNEALILRSLIHAYNGAIYAGGSSQGVIASWDAKSLTLNYNGSNQLASITVNVVLVGQNRYITCLTDVLPLNISITATATPNV